jgi:hypothetical protein
MLRLKIGGRRGSWSYGISIYDFWWSMQLVPNTSNVVSSNPS